MMQQASEEQQRKFFSIYKKLGKIMEQEDLSNIDALRFFSCLYISLLAQMREPIGAYEQIELLKEHYDHEWAKRLEEQNQ
jgi:hypothetical protein